MHIPYLKSADTIERMKKLFAMLVALLVISSGTSYFFGAPPAQGSFYPTGGGTYRLQSSIGTTNTSVRLSSFKEPISNIAYTMSYLNSDIQCGTIDPQTTRSEFISFTGITQNSDSSATLTGVSRGLGRTYPYTASTTLAQAHPGQSIFILSDAPCTFTQYPAKVNNETVTGDWNFNYPVASSSPATKGYVDSVIT
jgi:hypothetical protein